MNCGLITMYEFTNDLDTLINSLIKNKDNPNDKYQDSEIKLKFLNGISELRQKYNQDDFDEAVKEYLTNDSGIFDFEMFIEDGFDYLEQLTTLDIKQKTTTEVQEKESKMDSFSTTLEKTQKNNLKGQFLNKYFVLNSTGKLFFLNSFKNNIVRSIFINETGVVPTLVHSNLEMNNQISFYKQKLYQDIINSVSIINPDTARSFQLITSHEKALKYIEDIFIGNNSFISQDLLYKIPLLSQKDAIQGRDKILLEGYEAFVILSNFDPLMKLIFGKAIEITNMNQYDFDESEKYNLKLGDKNTNTWRDDTKDTDETEEIGSLAVLFLETLKMYDESGNPTNQNMNFSDIKVALGKLMYVFNLQNDFSSNIVFNTEVTTLLEEELKSIYGSQQIHDLLKQYVENKNFKQVLASAKENSSELMPIVFRLMLPIYNPNMNNVNINPLSGEFPKNGTKTKEVLQSIYYNIYSPSLNNSLINMSLSYKGLDPSIVSMYDFVNTLILNIENKPMLEYTADHTQGIVINSLSEKNANDRLKSITRALDGKFHKFNVLGKYIDNKTSEFNTFTIEDDLENQRGITITVGDYTIGVNSNLEVGIYKDQNQVKDINIESFLPFISEVLDIPLTLKDEFTGVIDNRLYNNYINLGGTDLDLIRLVSHILYNYQVGKHMLNTTESTYNEDVKKYYTQVAPKTMFKQFQPSLIPSFDYNTIKTISYAKDIVEGFSEVNTVKDGAGKQISTLALSSLLSKVGEIWENHTKSEDSPCRDFSIFSLFNGFELIRDFSGMGENKQGKDFTQAELAIASIIYDMYGDLEEIDENGKSSEKSEGILRIMGPVISDKSNLPKLKFKWNALLPQKYWKDINTPLRLRDLTNDDIKKIIKEEFGQYYKNVFDNITNQYNIINNYVSQACQNLGIENIAFFNYKNNFEEANEAYGNRTWEVLHEAIYLAQLSGNDPEIIDQVGYINNKGQLTNNPSIIHQMKLFGVADSLFKTSIPTDETYENFWNRKEIQLVTDFLQSGTVLKVKNGETNRNGNAIISAINHNKEFIHKENISIVKIINGDKSTKISQLSDFQNWYPYNMFIRSLEKVPSIYDINDPQFNISETIKAINKAKIGLEDGENFTIELNPEIVKHNLLDFFLGEEFIMATTGTYVSHPAKSNNIILRESEQFGQAIKRYVSYTASKHRESTNNLSGIPSKLNIAIIEDYRDSGLNYSGNYSRSSIKPFDGASFYSVTMNYLDNNSLGGDAMGVDKKPFAHYMGEKSGIGFILKTAGFPLTNDRIRNSEKFYENLNRQMLDIPWSQQMDWTKDYTGEDIDYGMWYVYDPNQNQWYARWNPRVENGETLFDQAKVTITGEILNDTLQEGLHWNNPINTNWQLWNLFGGMYSGHLNSDGNLQYEQDNTSVEMLVKAMNNVGISKYDTALGQNGVDQVLKKAQINIVATGGAVKYGGANINSQQAYFDPNYHLTYMQIDAYDIGEQLDAEHQAEHGTVSLMTQVVNALGARGYSREMAQECYEALETIAEVTNQNGLSGLEELNTSGNPELLKNSIAQIIYKTLTRVSDSDGNLLNALASTLVEVGSSKFDWSNIEGKFPISHPAIFQKMISSISSELEKSIRLKFEGNMFVLNPSNKIFTVINGRLAGQYKDHMDELIALEENNKANPIKYFEIKVGFNYRSALTGERILVDNPEDFYNIKQRILNGEAFYETVIENGEPLGHDLATYNAIFADQDGNYYSMWELDSAQALWELRDSEDFESIKLWRRQLQRDLNAIAEGLESTVSVNGKIVLVDKSKTQVSPYEIILPKMYKTEFGLKVSDNLDIIKQDQRFFIKRALENWKSKIDDTSLYDLELKTLNGEHIYLGQIPEEFNEDLTKISINREIDGDVMYRLSPNGERLYSIPYTIDNDGKYIPDIQVYKTIEGQEIIYSNNLEHFLDEFSYNTIIISNNENDKLPILQALNQSDNTVAKRKVDFIVRIVNRNFQKLLSEADSFIGSIGNTNLVNSEDLANALFSEDLNLTMEDILENESLLQQATDFIKNDINYYENKQNSFYNDLYNDQLTLEEISVRNPFFRGLINSGIDVHTSFLQSLEMVVSRTPAQSQQSFMSMYVAAFAMEDTNSAYVSRMQFLLQGSDLDIDKISLLGLIFKQGKLVTWSPYFNLKSQELFNASKELPFPTGKSLKVVESAEKRPFDVLRNDITVTTGEFGEKVLSTQNGNYISIFGTDNNFTINCSQNFDMFSPLEQYSLLRNAVSKIPEGAEINYNFYISERNLNALGIVNGINTKNYNINLDFDEFNESIFSKQSIEQDINLKRISLNILELAPALSTLIRVYNKLGYIPENANPNIKSIIDYHNLSLKGKEKKQAAQNFISIKTKDISKSPINQIQAQSAIDEQTAKVEELLKNPKYQRLVAQTQKADRGSVFSKFFMLTLTLEGKENVGIVASSLKNFEGISQYIYQVLDEGSEEDQNDLLFNRVINGHRIRMIANSYARNQDTIKNEQVLEALKSVDNDVDAFLVMSAFLSLATDNAKNPVLPKLNAGPTMISLYNSGIILGLSVEEIADLVLSNTGILLNKLTQSNVFNGQKGFGRLTQAIQYIQRPPSVYFTESQYSSMAPIFQRLGLLQPEQNFNKSSLDEILKNRYNRITIRKILRFIASPNGESSLLKFDRKLFANTQIAQIRSSSEYRQFSKKREELLNSLQLKKQNLNSDEYLSKEDSELLDKLTTYKYNKQAAEEKIEQLINYRDNEVVPTDANLLEALNNYIESSSEDFGKNLQTLRSNLYSHTSFVSNINQLIDWLNIQDIVENDLIEGVDGRQHKIINQISRLNEFSQELSVLRPLLALNQGIPNTLIEQLDFESNFGNIIQNRLDVIGKTNLEKFYNVSEELNKLSEFNSQLREKGLILNDGNYYVDLNTFIHNPEYNKLVKEIYGKIKFAANILKIIDGVSHYKSYLRIANLAIQEGKVSSVVYRTARSIENTIVQKMNVKSSSHKENVRKNIIPTIYRKLNLEFLKEQNITYNIPDFDIVDGRVLEKSEGKLLSTSLGTPETNEKFKQWIQYVEFPKWKNMYPNNKFIQSLGYRMYDFNYDHNQSINLAKVRQFNMKNPADQVLFNLTKLDLQKLPSNVIDKLFFYNIIAYNNQAGQLSLTDLFEDLISANNFESIRDYNTFISNHESHDISITESEKIKQEIAPLLSIYEVRPHLSIPYIYVRNNENGITYLFQKQKSNQGNLDTEDDNLNDEFFGNAENETDISQKLGFFETMNQSGYYLFGQTPEYTQFQELLEIGEYVISNSDNIKNITVNYQGKEYSSKEILNLAKEKGFTKLSEIFPKKKKRYDTISILGNLNTIFNEDC